MHNSIDTTHKLKKKEKKKRRKHRDQYEIQCQATPLVNKDDALLPVDTQQETSTQDEPDLPLSLTHTHTHTHTNTLTTAASLQVKCYSLSPVSLHGLNTIDCWETSFNLIVTWTTRQIFLFFYDSLLRCKIRLMLPNMEC